MKNTLKRMSLILFAVCVLVSTFAVATGVMAQDVAPAQESFAVTAVAESAEADIVKGTYDVAINFANTPDLWACRLFVIYSNELTLDKDGAVNGTMGDIFPESAAMWSAPDKALDDPKLMAELKSIVAAAGLDASEYSYAILYCELDDIAGSVKADGVLATLGFSFNENAKAGDTYSVGLYYDADADFIMHNGVDANGFPAFITYAPVVNSIELTATCSHDFAAATCTAAKTCKACGATEGTASGHKWVAATCTKAKTCSVCKTTTGKALGHKWAAATCTKAKTCSTCKATTGKALGHSYKTTTTKATLTKAGSIVKKCTRCANVASKTTIKAVKTIKLAATTYTYTGKAINPAVTVKDTAGKVLKKGTDYTVKYATGCKNVGTYKVTITFKGNYSGTKTLTFTINPAKITLGKVTGAAKSITIAWTPKTTQVTGYEIQYSTKKNLSGAKKVTITKTSTKSTTVKKLTKGTTYYVRIRAYKTVNGKKFYSAWSAIKSAKAK